MALKNLYVMLAEASAPGQPGSTPDPKAQLFQTLAMFGLMGVIFYFVLIRPQQKKAKAHTELLKSVKPGDKVLTSGGIVGVVITVKDKTVSIRSADAKLEITKAAVAEITGRGGESSES
jgi:preprotein translocase subunit YajC